MNDTKPSILILFNGFHLAYSPTIIQLCELMNDSFSITIYCYHSEKGFRKAIIPGVEVIYFKEKSSTFFHKIRILKGVFKNKRLFDKFRNYRMGGYRLYYDRILVIGKLLRNKKFKKIIAVDIYNLLICSLLGIKCDFLSLELCNDESLFQFVNRDIIDSVAIQSDIRYEYLLGNTERKKFIIPNSPNFHERILSASRKGLVYAGTAWKPFGFYYCLEYLKEYPDETLFVQGAIPETTLDYINNTYPSLLRNNQLTISDKYLENSEVEDLIDQFEIGFCFYDFTVDWINNFNYKSAPSGKLFKYLSVGVPVIANDIIGFQFVKENNCGILIEDFSPEVISNAVMLIRNNYESYSTNALRVAKEFDFKTAAKKYIDYLKDGIKI